MKDGVAYAPQQAEQKLRRVRIDTITEGIGIDRLTRNFTEHEDCISDALRIHDQDAVNMAWHLLRREGLFVGRYVYIFRFALYAKGNFVYQSSHDLIFVFFLFLHFISLF